MSKYSASQRQLRREWSSIKRKMVRSQEGYRRRYGSVFTTDVISELEEKYVKKNGMLPDNVSDLFQMPKKVTEGSIRKMNKLLARYKYEAKSIRIKVGRLQEAIGQEMDEDVREQILGFVPSEDDQIFYQLEQVLFDGLDAEHDITRRGYTPTSKQSAYFELVKHKADIALNLFDQAGGDDPKQRIIMSINIKEYGFEKLEHELEKWVWYDSDGGYSPNMDPLNAIIKVMTKPINVTEFEKKKVARATGKWQDTGFEERY